MKLTTKSEYSLLMLIGLARSGAVPGSDVFLRLDELCRQYDLPVKYAEQLIGAMKQAGMVVARRGAFGGYQLARSPEQISMAQVVRLMDGALAPTGAVSEHFPASSALEKEKSVIAVMKDIRDYVARVMETTTLADLI
jgi:Rrf2 family protein